MVRLLVRDDITQAVAAERFIASEAWVPALALAEATAPDLFRSRPALGFTDCLILESARRAGHLPMGTFDSISRRRPERTSCRAPIRSWMEVDTDAGQRSDAGANPTAS